MTAFALSSVKPERGIGMEGFIAKWYANLTRKALDDFRALARQVSVQLPPDADVLEVAPGPGYFAIELAKLGDYRITGLDISKTFVEIARSNAAQANVQVDFRQGNASGMPFKSDSFDFLLCRAAFKNFGAPLGALREMHRVLKPGGRALIIDLRKDASNESVVAGSGRDEAGRRQPRSSPKRRSDSCCSSAPTPRAILSRWSPRLISTRSKFATA